MKIDYEQSIMNGLYALFFETINVTDEEDMMCHYATEKEYELWNKKENKEKAELKVTYRLLNRLLNVIHYPFKWKETKK